MTYEGGASINGQFLGSLGARAAAISIIAGAGEFLGYSLRFAMDTESPTFALAALSIVSLTLNQWLPIPSGSSGV
jgi:hypothetical protein